ncbi:MAG: hypothetical protein GX058_02915 [Firmicutes bacterium]|nr:hypothetical protein [Bacillota bacterium]
MKAQIYVDRLFQGYEDTPELRDFKEEIASNLRERIAELEEKGYDPEKAFELAVAELGDITAIADQISREKRNEVIGRMYMGWKVPMGRKHALGYVVSGGVLAFGIVVALMNYFTTGRVFTALAALIPFVILPVAALVFLRLTQETAARYPMPWRRALVYAIITAITLFGLNTSVMLHYLEEADPSAVLGVLIPFVIPGLCIGAFLVLTEKPRYKPWVAEQEKIWTNYYAKEYNDPRSLEQRGLLSGALWLFAVAVFFTLGFLIGFRYAWVTFLFAIAGEMLIEYWQRVKSAR